MKQIVLLLLSTFVFSLAKDIRFFNSIPTSPITVNYPPNPVFEVEYGKATLYETVVGNSISFNVTKSNNASYFIQSGEVSLSFSNYYTFATILNPNGNESIENATIFLKAFFEDLVNPPNWTPGQALVRFIHLAALVGPVSIRTGNRVIFNNLEYGVDTTYFSLNVENTTPFDTNSGNETRQYTAALLQPNAMYTIFITSPSLESSINETGFSSAQFWLVYDRNFTFATNQTTNTTRTGSISSSSQTNSQSTRTVSQTNSQSQSSQSQSSQSTPGSQTRSESSTSLAAQTTAEHAVSSGMKNILSVLIFLVSLALF